MSNNWKRVTRQNPCPICGKPDWCTVGEIFIQCMRIESARPCVKSGGWFHPIKDAPRKPRVPQREQPAAPQPEPQIDAAKMMREFAADVESGEQLLNLADDLGVDWQSLARIGTTWSAGHRAWAFAMRDGDANVIGIRLRDHTGHKWAVRGSRAGLFYDPNNRADVAYIVEGPTDCAAAMDLGVYAIGRPSCMGSEQQVIRVVERVKVREVIIVSDNDSPGWRGAERLQALLKVRSVIFVPPAKDMRDFVRAGGTRRDIEALIKGLAWSKPAGA